MINRICKDQILNIGAVYNEWASMQTSDCHAGKLWGVLFSSTDVNDGETWICLVCLSYSSLLKETKAGKKIREVKYSCVSV